MATYEKSFKEEAVKLSDEIGIKKAAAQLGVPYYTLADWRHRQNIHGDQAHVQTGGTVRTFMATRRTSAADTSERRETRKIGVYGSLSEKTRNLPAPMRFCRRRSVFSQRTERSKSPSAIQLHRGQQ